MKKKMWLYGESGIIEEGFVESVQILDNGALSIVWSEENEDEVETLYAAGTWIRCRTCRSNDYT